MSAPSKITATCKRYILRIVITLCGLVLFHTTINKLFNELLKLLPIEFGKGYVDITLGILTLLGAVFIPLRWFERYKNQLFVIWGFGVFLHLLDTFYWKEWSYIPMSFSMISYVVFFLYVFPFVFVVKGTVEKAHYLQKEEIEKEKLNDSFGYNTHAKKLLEFIKNRKGRDSYAIGINAKWGEGKSFFIDLFKEELVNSDKDLIVVDFKPWFSHSPLDIINDFFTVFGERLEEEGIYIQSDLEKYKEALMGIEVQDSLLNQAIKALKGLVINDSKSSSLLYERINNVLKEENRRIIVVIDDLDRLTKEELFEVIKLVRNSGSLKNTFFLLAYDRVYLEEALKSLQIGIHDKYLEKVIQMELKLPIIPPDEYLSYASEYILREYKEYSEDWFVFIKNVGKYFNANTDTFSVFNKNLCNIRYVEYFIDRVLYSFKSIKDEVDFSDYLVISLMIEEEKFDLEDFLTSIINAVPIIKDNFKSKYIDNKYLNNLFVLLETNSSNRSFLHNKERRITYLNVFSENIEYISIERFRDYIIGNTKTANVIDLLNNNIVWKKDFIKRIGELPQMDVFRDENAVKMIGDNLINIINGILKGDKDLGKDTTYLIKDGIRGFHKFLFLLKDKFGLSINEIKQLLFDMNYACDFRATILGFIIRGQLSPIKIEDLQPILTEKDVLFINTNFLRLALKDQNLSPIEKIGFFWQLELSGGNEYVFHDEARELMFNYIANHVNDFGNVILGKDVEYKFHELFGNKEEFLNWVQNNSLEDNSYIKTYNFSVFQDFHAFGDKLQ